MLKISDNSTRIATKAWGDVVFFEAQPAQLAWHSHRGW
jgi:hypothetical protein